ncbi:MAG: alpha/beta hydrolase [Desulfoprunum sp.]|jgi:hypothetical protein|uniref:alpha/beta hydrolase n=1 Tax=Desulfoprunum sp. TaxID=2020866 RepID=UPI003C776595
MTEHCILDRPEYLAHIFFPVPADRSPLPDNAEDVFITVTEGVRLGCRLYAAAPDSPTILYFHGNGEVVSDYDEIADDYRRQGLNLFIATYRGYGWSDGTPTVTAMFSDALTISSFVTGWLAENKFGGPLIVMGRSLGSASAIEIALHHGQHYKGMILESGFADTLPLAEALGIGLDGVDIREQDCFNNGGKIAGIKLPTLILHGARDQLIPPYQAEKLQMQSGARNKQFLLIPGADHNSLITMAGVRYFQCIRKFIDEICGLNTWRQRRRKFQDNDNNRD